MMLYRTSMPACVTLAVLILISSAGAVGKVTIDPNAAGVAAPTEISNTASDSRLAKNITYEARQKTVSVILGDLTRLTSVTLKAGYNAQDWQVRDRKMNVFAKDLPLATLMSSIARVMKFKWSISKGTPPSYRLYMDRRTLLDADAKRARRIEKNIKWQTGIRQSWIEDIANVGKLSDQDLDKLKETNPYLYMYRKTGMSDALDAFFKSAPDLANAFATGQEMTLPVSDLPSDAQRAIMQLRDAIRMIRAIRDGKAAPSPEPAPNLNSINLLINEGKDRLARDGANSMYTGFLNIRYGPRYSDKDLSSVFPNPEFQTTKLFGREMVQCLEEGKSVEQIHQQPPIDAAQVADRLRFGQEDTPDEKTREHPDDPALQKKVKCQPEDARLSSLLAELAKESGLCIVSDSFGRPHTRPQAIQGEMNAREVLDKVETIYGEDWEKNGSVLELRNKDWFMKRSAQIPEAWLEDWRQEAKTTGTLDLNTLWQINKLTYGQLLTNIIEDEILGKLTLHVDYSIVKICDCLQANQRRSITTASTIIQLNESQITALADLLRAQEPAGTSVTLTITREPVAKHFDYEVKLSGPDGLQFGAWKQSTPEYTEPSKDKPAQTR